MTRRPETPPDATTCNDDCSSTSSAETLNHTCYCISVDMAALHQMLATELGVGDLSPTLVNTHPHLFASLPVFIASHHLEQMAKVVEAVERVVASPVFQRAAMSWAPSIARFDAGPRGGLLSYDFHLTDAGAQLIEINTNPGGAFLNAVLARAQRACCTGAAGLTIAPVDTVNAEQALLDVLNQEWRLQRGNLVLRTIAIADDAPQSQYLYPEFLLVRQLLTQRGIDAVICDPSDLTLNDARLWYRGKPIDLIYNRLTDFSLQLPAHESIMSAYLAGDVVLTPHPRAHAVYADKRNLTLLCDGSFLHSTGATQEVIATLVGSIPHTQLLTAENRDALWKDRRHLFFKPAAGYGSKATYRGDKLTKRVWQEIAGGTYVAQSLVVPSHRQVLNAEGSATLKVDVRNYAYNGSVILVAARLYQGQVTNFRTSGGGFAPVLTSRGERHDLVQPKSAKMA